MFAQKFLIYVSYKFTAKEKKTKNRVRKWFFFCHVSMSWRNRVDTTAAHRWKVEWWLELIACPIPCSETSGEKSIVVWWMVGRRMTKRRGERRKKQFSELNWIMLWIWGKLNEESQLSSHTLYMYWRLIVCRLCTDTRHQRRWPESLPISGREKFSRKSMMTMKTWGGWKRDKLVRWRHEKLSSPKSIQIRKENPTNSINRISTPQNTPSEKPIILSKWKRDFFLSLQHGMRWLGDDMTYDWGSRREKGEKSFSFHVVFIQWSCIHNSKLHTL